MADLPIEVRLSGEDAEFHQLPAYDGFGSLAGLSLATTLVTHYAVTGSIRRKGQFETRSKIRFKESRRGSVVFGLIIEFAASNPLLFGGVAGALGVNLASSALYDLIKSTFKKNVGQDHTPQTKVLESLTETRGGDLEALAAATEPALRQAHTIIQHGASSMEITGRNKANISTFNAATKDYILKSIEDDAVIEKDVSVAAFNANSGHGRIFDEDIGRTVAIYIPEHSQKAFKAVLSWGLNEYARGTGRKISLKFTRILTWDDRPKKYIVLDANIPQD